MEYRGAGSENDGPGWGGSTNSGRIRGIQLGAKSATQQSYTPLHSWHSIAGWYRKGDCRQGVRLGEEGTRRRKCAAAGRVLALLTRCRAMLLSRWVL